MTYGKSTLLVLIALRAAHRTTGIHSTCEAGSVNEGDPINITCHFDNDIRKLQLDVNVNRFYPEVTVLSFAWFDGEPLIHCIPGITFDGIISNKLTLRITNAKKETFDGEYMCKVAQSGQQETFPCTLKVLDFKNDSQTSSMISTETATSNSSEQEVGTEIHVFLPLGLSILALLLMSLILVLMLIRRERKIKRKHNLASEHDLPLTSETNANGYPIVNG